MRYSRFLLLVLIMAGILSSCDRASTSQPSTPTPILSSQARAYLTTALDIMQRYSINRKKIDWTALREQSFAVAADSKTPADTYPAIEMALATLGDNHSRFIDPQQANQQRTGAITADQKPLGQLLIHKIGYLELPHFEASKQAAQQYAMLAQDAIRTVDRTGTCGWVVDLRKNYGGNVWPMFAGVGPILGEGVVSWSVDADGVKLTSSYSHGQVQGAGSIMISVQNAYSLKHPLPPVAILTGPDTASAGEQIAVSFRGRPHTRSFGEPTYGVPTGNGSFMLSDGALLVVTEAVDADRTGRTYDSPITPDQPVPMNMFQTSATDQVVQAATAWLHNQEGC